MQCTPRRFIGLLLAAALTFSLTLWLAVGQSQAVGIQQETSVLATDQPSVVETPTDTPIPPPVEIPTDTPVPPTPELPTEVPTEIPTETPTDTPTPEPTFTPLPPTETPTQTPTPSPTVRPIVILTPTPDTTLYGVAEGVVNAAITSAAWIWLTCGSLLFFGVAGTIAGISFYHQSRNRFKLYEVVPEEEVNILAPKSRPRDTPLPPDEDSWPSSLP